MFSILKSSPSFADELKSIRMTFFVGNNDDVYEPSAGILTVADGTMNSSGHLFAASKINGGPEPDFLPSWVYEYIIDRIKSALKSAAKMDDTSSLGNMYQKVILFSFL